MCGVSSVVEAGGIDGNLAIEGKEHEAISGGSLPVQCRPRWLPTGHGIDVNELDGRISGMPGDEAIGN